MFLSIKDLKKSFGEDEYKTEVLKGIDFEIEKMVDYIDGMNSVNTIKII